MQKKAPNDDFGVALCWIHTEWQQYNEKHKKRRKEAGQKKEEERVR